MAFFAENICNLIFCAFLNLQQHNISYHECGLSLAISLYLANVNIGLCHKAKRKSTQISPFGISSGPAESGNPTYIGLLYM